MTRARSHSGGGHMGSLAHTAACAMKRRGAIARAGVFFLVTLFLVVETTRRAFEPAPCDPIPSDAPVAVLVAGSTLSVNRTHCSLARRVIAPLRRRGHRVVLFVAAADVDGDGSSSYGASASAPDDSVGAGGKSKVGAMQVESRT